MCAPFIGLPINLRTTLAGEHVITVFRCRKKNKCKAVRASFSSARTGCYIPYTPCVYCANTVAAFSSVDFIAVSWKKKITKYGNENANLKHAFRTGTSGEKRTKYVRRPPNIRNRFTGVDFHV